MKNEVGVVVSRYYEDLTWIHDLKAPIDVYVYNRNGESPGMGVPHAVSWAKPKDHNDLLGGLNIDTCKENGINLQIIDIEDDPGFEASTYSYHMYSKYDELNDHTVFIQGHPEIYMKNVIGILNDPGKIKYTSYVKNPSGNTSPCTAVIKDSLIDFEAFSDCYAVLNPHEDYQWSLYRDDFSKAPWIHFCKYIPENAWEFGAGNQFIASKNLIHRNDKDFYLEVQKFTNSYMDPNGDSRPHWQQLNQGPNILEGIWKLIF